MKAIDFLSGNNKMCNYFAKNGGCKVCPMYSSTWDCDRHCFTDPQGSIRVVEAFLAKGLV